MQIDGSAGELRAAWLGRTLAAVRDCRPAGLERHLANVAGPDLQRLLEGLVVCQVARHGRHLMLTFHRGFNPHHWVCLQWTPGPTGRWVPPGQRGRGAPAFEFDFGSSGVWGYEDVRGWGRFWLWSYGEVITKQAGAYSMLGPDWLASPREAAAALRQFTPGSTRTAKSVLLDQQVTAGLNGALSCEVLYRARIHPNVLWRQLSPADRSTLAICATEVTQTINSAIGFLVLDREADWCLRPDCLGSISSITDLPPLMRQSFICSQCQVLPEMTK